jgi:hypothetical protein
MLRWYNPISADQSGNFVFYAHINHVFHFFGIEFLSQTQFMTPAIMGDKFFSHWFYFLTEW